MSEYQQASPCGGVLFYHWLDGDIKFYLSERIIDGKPSGLHSIYGGFAECSDFLKQPIGYSHNILVEIHRECKEEIGPEFADLIPEHIFVKNAQIISTAMVRTADTNKIHSGTMVAYEVDERFANFLANHAKPTEEQMPAKPYSIKYTAEHKDLISPYNGDELLKNLVMPEGIKMFHEHEKNPFAIFLNSLLE